LRSTNCRVASSNFAGIDPQTCQTGESQFYIRWWESWPGCAPLLAFGAQRGTGLPSMPRGRAPPGISECVATWLSLHCLPSFPDNQRQQC
jgi:hypothetical protein